MQTCSAFTLSSLLLVAYSLYLHFRAKKRNTLNARSSRARKMIVSRLTLLRFAKTKVYLEYEEHYKAGARTEQVNRRW
jgi:hypothetical protein